MRKLSYLFSVLLVFVLVTSTVAVQPIYGSPSSWAVNYVNTAISQGLVPTNLQSNYTQPATRAEFSALAVALYENQRGTIAGRMQFSDTNNVNVQKAAYIGIVTGVGNNNFAPNNTITRQEAAVMISNLAEAIGQPLPASSPTFADANQFSSWAVNGVGQVQAAGIMGGVGNNRFDPQGLYTREQSTVSIVRLLEILAGSGTPAPTQPATQPPTEAATQPPTTEPPTEAPTPAPTQPAATPGVRQQPTGSHQEAPFEGTRSQISIPNRRLSAGERQNWINEYVNMGGGSWFEYEVIRLVNVERARYGLGAVRPCHVLMMSSRFYAQTKANLNTNLGHTEGPYGGSFETSEAFGDRAVVFWAGNALAGYWTPAEAVQAWMNSPMHRSNILEPDATRTGVGFHLGGQWGVFGYKMFSGGQPTPSPV